MRLIVIRHGETTYNVEDRLTGQSDIPLSPLGEQQANAVAAYLATEKFFNFILKMYEGSLAWVLRHSAIMLFVSIATLAFYVAFRLAEDYLLVPKIIGKVVEVPAVATLVAVLIGGALLGLVGALVAIPVAAAIQLLLQELLFTRLDET